MIIVLLFLFALKHGTCSDDAESSLNLTDQGRKSSISYESTTIIYQTSTSRPPTHFCRLGNCQKWTIVVHFLLLTSSTIELDFNLAKNFAKFIIMSCSFSRKELKVSYAGAMKSGSFAWITDAYDFFQMQQQSTETDFLQYEHVDEDDFSAILTNSITEINRATPSGFGKYILIISNMRLTLRTSDAKELDQKLLQSGIQLKIMEMQDANRTAEEASNLNLVVDGQVGHMSKLLNIEQYFVPCYMPPPRPHFGPGGDHGRPPWDPARDKLYQVLDETRQLFGQGRPKSASAVIVVSVVSGVVLCVLLFAGLFIFYSRTKFRLKAQIERFRAEASHNNAPPNQYEDFQKRDEWNISKDNLEIFYTQKLGSGAFCNVFKGKLTGIAPVCKINPSIQASRSYTDCYVAVKMLPSFADDLARSDFIQEINFMKSLNYHPHLICMLGAVSEKLDDPCLVTEYCSRGDLLHYVREKKEEILNGYSNLDGLKLKDLVSFAWQISDGLDYLSSKGCIHRDVAARNVLVDNMNTAKIADFGLCRLTDRSLYTARGGRLPIKWMAIESLINYTYSSKSDVWSFGVLLFELFSMGEVPFPRIQPADMIDYLEAGNRLPRPQSCTLEIYEMMKKCWWRDPNDRPSFEMLRGSLSKILETASENYGYLPVKPNDYVITQPNERRRSRVAHVSEAEEAEGDKMSHSTL